MEKELRIVAPLHNRSSFARHARGILRTALLAGYKVQCVETDWNEIVTGFTGGAIIRTRTPMGDINELPDFQREELAEALRTEVSPDAPTLILHIPTKLSDYPDYSMGPRIGVAMIESDRVHPRMKNVMRNMDMLCAPSPYVANIFSRDVTPTRVFPVPVDDRLWSPEGDIFDMEDRPDFLFLSVFEISERKNWRILLHAFAEEFRGESVGLYCKVSGNIQEFVQLAAECRDIGAWIRADTQYRSYEEMAALYRNADCYVSPGAEGFGMPFAEAALCGTPGAGLDKGGQEHLVTYPIPSVMKRIEGLHPYLYSLDQRFPSCCPDELRKTMREAYDDICIRGRESGENVEHKIYLDYVPMELAESLDRIVMQAHFNFMREQKCALQSVVSDWRGDGLTVGICSHNHLAATEACIDSVRQWTPKARIILADHASSDGTPEWARSNGVEVIDCGEDGNVSRNRNLILNAVRPGDYVAFLDNDVIVSDGWAYGLRAFLDENSNLGAISAWNEIPGHPDNCHCGTFLHEGGRFELCRLRRSLSYVDTVSGSCFMIRAEIALEFRFDEEIPFWNEDWDFGCQLRVNGWDLGGTYDVRVQHIHNTTSPERKAEADMRNRQFLRKWRSIL